MTVSRQEEIILTLWVIATLTAFGHGYIWWAYVFAAKASLDFLCVIYFSFKEIKEERKVNEQDS